MLPFTFQNALCAKSAPWSFSLSTDGKSISKWSTPTSTKNCVASSNRYGGLVCAYCLAIFEFVLGNVRITSASGLLSPNACCNCCLVMIKSAPFLPGAMVINSDKKKNWSNVWLIETKSRVICPTHSVCVPCACGLNQISLKLVLAPCSILPTKSPSLCGVIFGWSTYHAFTLVTLPRSGMEISSGFAKFIWYSFLLCRIMVCITVSILQIYFIFIMKRSAAIPSAKNLPFLVANNTSPSKYNKCSLINLSACNIRYSLYFFPNSAATLFTETPQIVRSPVIMYSLYLSVVDNTSVSIGKTPLLRALMYFVLLLMFQPRLCPSKECAEGPIPMYFFCCQ